MASGSFSSSVYNAVVVTTSGSGVGTITQTYTYPRYIEVQWNQVVDNANNRSTINFTAYCRSTKSETSSRIHARNIVISFNGTSVTLIGSASQAFKNGETIGTGSVVVPHNADGRKTDVSAAISSEWYTWGTPNSTYSGTINLDPAPVYSLSISAGTGSTITVARTSSPGGSTGNLTSGTKLLYYGDTLKVTFAPQSNYTLLTQTVNGSAFTSGGTTTVTGNVTVASTAQPLKSTIAATNASIGGVSTITITRYNSSYTSTVTYKAGTATGTVATKTSQTSIPWTVPSSIYSQIPSGTSISCTLTVETFNGNTSLGTATTTITLTTTPSENAPTVTGSIVDTNSATISLTGNSAVLVRNRSTAVVTITATPKNSASITSLKISGVAVTGTASGSSVVGTKTFSEVNQNSFTFEAQDSRGYVGNASKSATMVNYVSLTCNPTIDRPQPTGDELTIAFSGDYFSGSFGAYNNTLSIKYRYRKVSDESFGEWQTLGSDQYTISGTSYTTPTPISLGHTFDYTSPYVFEIQAYDGANGVTLTSIQKTIDVSAGLPVFDWGRDDFRFNVPMVYAEAIDSHSVYAKSFGGSAGTPSRIFYPTHHDYNGTSITTQGAAMQDVLKKICSEYSDAPLYSTFSGIFDLNGTFHFEVTMYRPKDTVNGLPRYCRGVYHPAFLANNNEISIWDFGTYNGVWRLLGVPTNGTNASFKSIAGELKASDITSAPTSTNSFFFGTSAALSVGGVTIPKWSKGVFIADSSDGVIIAIDPNGNIYSAFRNSGSWSNTSGSQGGTTIKAPQNIFLTGGDGKYIGASNFRIYNLTIAANSTATVATNSWGGGIFMGMVGNVGGDVRIFNWNDGNIAYRMNASGDNTNLVISRNSAGTLSLKQTVNGTKGVLIIGNYSLAT